MALTQLELELDHVEPDWLTNLKLGPRLADDCFKYCKNAESAIIIFAGASSGSDADERSSPLLRKSPALGPQLVLPFIPPKFAADSSTLRPSEYLKSLQVKILTQFLILSM